MKIDFSGVKFNPNAFSERPLHLAHPQALTELAGVMEIIAIETGTPRARKNWQQAQLRNLINHAITRSPFWRNRLKMRDPANARLRDIPVLTRRDVVEQVRTEGSIIHPIDKIGVATHSTSGSSGTPVEFFYSDANAVYNVRRSLAQFFMEDRTLDCNWTRFKSLSFSEINESGSPKNGFKFETTDNWLGALGQMFRCGHFKFFRYTLPNTSALMRELTREKTGYLNIQTRLLEALISNDDAKQLASAGVVMVIPVSGKLDSDIRQRIEAAGIPVRGTYSCEEAGQIGSECPVHAEHYHVSSSNMLVEVDGCEMVQDGKRLGRILITHLHSYATPFIRYDLGDLGALSESCPCGFKGPTLLNIIGRSKNVIKHRDGSLTPFLPRAKDLLALGEFPEYRIRQTALDQLVMEIGGCTEITPKLHTDCERLLKTLAGDDMQVDIRAVQEIDWGSSVKRPLFTNEVI